MTEENQQAASTEQPETLAIADLNEFVQVLSHWHARKVAMLEHMLSVPEGTVVELPEIGEKELTGDLYQGFLIGLTLGLIELGQLPFTVQLMGEDGQPIDEARTPPVDATVPH